MFLTLFNFCFLLFLSRLDCTPAFISLLSLLRCGNCPWPGELIRIATGRMSSLKGKGHESLHRGFTCVIGMPKPQSINIPTHINSSQATEVSEVGWRDDASSLCRFTGLRRSSCFMPSSDILTLGGREETKLSLISLSNHHAWLCKSPALESLVVQHAKLDQASRLKPLTSFE